MSVTSDADWLLDVEIDGRAYRWSVFGATVTTADGTELVYRPGLGDLEIAAGDAAAVTVTDPSVDWPAIAPQLDGRIATVRRYLSGRWETAEVYSIGEAVGVSFGAADEPVSWSIEPVSGSASLGFQVPDPAATISYSTWPILAGQSVGQFAAYPVLLGLPGYIAEAATMVGVMPLCIAQFPIVPAAANTWVVIGEDGQLACTACTIRNDTLDTQATETVTVVSDLLGRRILAANFSLSGVPLPTSSNDRCFAGFSPAGGGGPRSAYDVIVYLLRRWGIDSVDWARLPEARDVLTPFLVDTWIDSPVSDPWAWIEGLVDDLPVAIRTGRLGRYFVAKRYVSDPTRRVGAVTAGTDVTRVSPVSRDGTPANEFSATYRRYFTGESLGKVILTGSSSPVSSPRTLAFPSTDGLQYVTVARHGGCHASLARYGLRQGDALEIDWTWDTATVAACLALLADRQALPAFLVSYEVTAGESLREGDELLLTDDELGWSAVPAIVEMPPVRGTTTTALLRVLA